MKKMMVILMAMMMVLGTAAFADTDFVPGQRMGQQLDGEALEAFHDVMLEQKQEWIDGLVEEGIISAEDGESFMTSLEENMDSCDGTQKYLGRSLNMGAGNGFGAKSGFGQGNGSGNGLKNGQGRGRWQADE